MTKAKKQVEAEVVEVEKGQKFNCAICGIDWESKVKRAGPRLCVTCVELRRSLNSFLKKGLETEELKTYVEKILTSQSRSKDLGIDKLGSLSLTQPNHCSRNMRELHLACIWHCQPFGPNMT